MASLYSDVHTLVLNASELFEKRFGRKPTVAVCSPGRVNLIGDHVDYNGGFVLPMGLPLTTVAVGSINDLNICRIESQGMKEPNYVEFASTSVEPGEPKWANYIKGVVACFHESTMSGFDCVIVSSVPVGAGLSSSAAVEVATYTLLESLLNSPSSNLKSKALACQKAEHEYANVPCGIMDQFVCTMAKAGCAFLLDCKSMEARHVPLDDPSVCVLIIDSGVKHQLSGSEYPLRRAQCEQAAKTLNAEFLRDVSREELEANKSALEEEVYRRALHVVNETEYTLKFVAFLENKNYAEAGKCMLASHNSLSTLYDVSCPELDAIVEIASGTNGIYGCRMTGGGFGGCVVALVEKSKVTSAIEDISNQCQSKALVPTFYIGEPSEGARCLII